MVFIKLFICKSNIVYFYFRALDGNAIHLSNPIMLQNKWRAK